MNFALLGTSPLIRQFESHLADSKAHQRVFSLPDVNQIDLFEIEQSGAQVIVLDGIGDEPVLLRGIEVLKAFDGLVLIAQLCTRTVLTAYEVERLAGDAVGLFAPILPLLQHPAMELFCEAQTDSHNQSPYRYRTDRAGGDGAGNADRACRVRVGCLCSGFYGTGGVGRPHQRGRGHACGKRTGSSQCTRHKPERPLGALVCRAALPRCRIGTDSH